MKKQTHETNYGDLLYVPLFLTESLLPYRGSHQSFTRTYQQTDITIQGGADRNGLIPLPTGVPSDNCIDPLTTNELPSHVNLSPKENKLWESK